jgi:hypothetical protein
MQNQGMTEAADQVTGTAASFRLWAVRELAGRDVAEQTDSTDAVLEMCARFPAEARQYAGAYAEGIRYAKAVASGEWPVRGGTR